LTDTSGGLTVARSIGLTSSVRILITDQNFGDEAAVERELVAAAGGELVVETCLTENDVAAALARHEPDALLVQFAPVGKRALAGAGTVRAIVRYGVGLDNIDTDAASAHGIAVSAIPDYCVHEVADHTIGLLLAVERGIVDLAAQTRAGGWDFRGAGPVRRLRGRTLGSIGWGRIAQEVGLRAQAFGLEVVAHDPAYPEGRAFDEVLRRADVLTLHVPLTDQTRGLIGARELDLLPEGAVVLNTARGGLIDEDALVDALRTGRLRGAGVDVLAEEPPPADHPLRRHPGVVLTPHAAWFSRTAVRELREQAVAKAIATVNA
jgi:D-3-phosphoglycerate dehydrogenase / 2-oxoglutarate reductase